VDRGPARALARLVERHRSRRYRELRPGRMEPSWAALRCSTTSAIHQTRSPDAASGQRQLRRPYRFQDLEVDASVVMTNKSLTGPTGLRVRHLYFETERMMDLLAERVELDPVEVRRRNLIQPRSSRTARRLEASTTAATTRPSTRRSSWRAIRRSGRAGEGARRGSLLRHRVALAVDPSVSNMGYVATALDPQLRAKPEYLRSRALWMRDDQGGSARALTAVLATTPRGRASDRRLADRGRRTRAHPEDVTSSTRWTPYTRFWSILLRTYSSRFGSFAPAASRWPRGSSRRS